MGYKNNCEKRCITEIDIPVSIDTELEHNYRCDNLGGIDTQYEVELDFDLKPEVCVRRKKCADDRTGCHQSCAYLIDLKFPCQPTVNIKKGCNPNSRHNVHLELEAKPKCNQGAHIVRKRGWGGDKSYCDSSSYSSSYSDECDKPKSKCSNGGYKKNKRRGWN